MGHFCRESAKEYYDKAHDTDGLIESLYHLENYEELEKCIEKIPEKNPLLGKLGQMLGSVGTWQIILFTLSLNHLLNYNIV